MAVESEVLEGVNDRSDEEWVAVAVEARKKSDSSSWDEADAYVVLRDRGYTQQRVADECDTKQQRVSIFERCARTYSLGSKRPSFWEAYQDVRTDKTTAEKLVASNENEWYTPAKYIEAARRVLGAIDLDPASCVKANETVRAERIYTKDDDGLDRTWSGRVWLNPPYGKEAGSFVVNLVDEFKAGRVTAAITLVNAHCTDTAWFQHLWGATLCFTDHRIDFDSGDRSKTSTSTHGSVFAYLGTDPQAFAREFSPYGVIVRRWQA